MAYLKRSPWVIHYDGASCNGCDIEVLAALMPVFDAERFGVINTGNPKHADILLLTGTINEPCKDVVQNIYNQMPDPKVVVALGICATSGGIFAECYNVAGGADKILPVDIYAPGCAVRPESVIDAVVKAAGILEQKRARIAAMRSHAEELVIGPAAAPDAVEILALQKLAYRAEAELYNEARFSPLVQTLDELTADFRKHTFLKAVMDDIILGSVRAYEEGGTCFVSRLIVHPVYQNLGVGKKLMRAIEREFPQAKRFEIYTGHRTKARLFFYKKIGYRAFKTVPLSATRQRVFMQKTAKG